MFLNYWLIFLMTAALKKQSTAMSLFNFFTICDPIVETNLQIQGGPWCFAIDKRRVFLVFPNKNLAALFLTGWQSSSVSNLQNIISLNEINEKYQEILSNIDCLLVLSTAHDVSLLLSDLEKFPYDRYLIPKQQFFLQ